MELAKAFVYKSVLVLLVGAFSAQNAAAGPELTRKEAPAGPVLTLIDALARAYASNPEIAAARARVEQEKADVGWKSALANPRIGLMTEKDLYEGQVGMGPMRSWLISQEILFPTKYGLLADVERAGAEAATSELTVRKLETRQRLLTAYAGLYSARRILALLEAQREALREIARIAEARRATGAVPQQDEMKAHMEQTKIENEIILQKQEVEEFEALLNAVLNRGAGEPIAMEAADFHPPHLRFTRDEIEAQALAHSSLISTDRTRVAEAGKMTSLARASYAPDFMISFRKPFENAPSGAYAWSVEMTLPLWFFSRQVNEVASASAAEAEAKHRLESRIRDVQARVKILAAKVESYDKLIQVYQTALIPQATSTLNSSRAAYSTGRTGFLELLDSERSLYGTRVDYYRSFAKYVEALSQLESVAGLSLSSLPFGEDQ